MQIGIDISQAVYGTGVSDYLIGLVNHLPPAELKLWGGSLRQGNELKALFPQAGIAPLPPTAAHWLWNVGHVVPIEWLVGKVDIWHSSDWAQPPTKAHKVTTVHDLAAFLYPSEMDPQIVAVQQARMEWVIKEVEQIICVSKNTASDLKRLFSVADDRIKVILEALPERFKLKSQISKATNYLVTIGARQPRKNTARLVSAFITFKAKYNLPSKLIVIGEYTRDVTDPDITFTGYISDQQMVDLLAGAQAFVFPSLYEGFGLPILGAFYHSVPVACANTSSLPEVAGNAAQYFDPLDEEDLASAISQAIANKEKLIAAGKRQLAKFSWESTAAQTYQVYRSLI